MEGKTFKKKYIVLNVLKTILVGIYIY